MKRLLFVLLVACGGKGESKHDDHAHDHEARQGHPEEAAAPGVLRIDREMLRDLRVTTSKAESRAAGERVSVLGELSVNEETYAEIAAPVAARVTAVLVEPGATVKANQPLAELHSPELGKARAELGAARIRAELAGKTVERQRGLAGEKLVTERELREAEAAASQAQADLGVAQATLNSFGAEGGGAKIVLRSPVAGTVIERRVVRGQLADPTRTLFRVGDLSQLWLIAHVFERDAVRVTIGGEATVAFAALPGKSFVATIRLIGREVEPSSRTIPVRLDLPNPDGVLRPGMSASVALPLGDETGQVVTVPLASVQRVGAGWVVFVPRTEEGSFDVRPIGRGRELGGEVEVLSGLTAKDSVVVDGAFLLKAEADKARGEGGGHDH